MHGDCDGLAKREGASGCRKLRSVRDVPNVFEKGRNPFTRVNTLEGGREGGMEVRMQNC